MAQNSTVVAALQADPVPAGRECVKTLTDILKGAEDFLKVTGLASAAPGTPFPSSNNTAAQALATANSALSIAQTLQSNTKQKRSSGSLIALAAADSVQSISWSPAMPSANYEIRVTLYGPNSALAAAFSWHVVDGTQDLTSAQLRFDNVPAAYSYAWVVEEL